MTPDISNAIIRYERPVKVKRQAQQVVDFLPKLIPYCETEIMACIQYPTAKDLRVAELDTATHYIKAIYRKEYKLSENDLIIDDNCVYKIFSVQDWKNIFSRVIAEEYESPLLQLDLFQYAICYYIQELIKNEKETIVFGRSNFYKTDKNGQYIVIDEVAIDVEGQTRFYESTQEVADYGTIYSNTFSISFYGSNALIRSQDFIARQKTPQAQLLQDKCGLNVGNATNLTQFKEQDGNIFREFVSMNVICKYTHIYSNDLERIETINMNIKGDE